MLDSKLNVISKANNVIGEIHIMAASIIGKKFIIVINFRVSVLMLHIYMATAIIVYGINQTIIEKKAIPKIPPTSSHSLHPGLISIRIFVVNIKIVQRIQMI